MDELTRRLHTTTEALYRVLASVKSEHLQHRVDWYDEGVEVVKQNDKILYDKALGEMLCGAEEKMERDMLELQIAAAPVRDRIPTDKPLRERLQFAMRYVREHERDLFWMSGSVTDDAKFRTALAAVMLSSGSEDRSVIERSMKPLRMLNAAIQGIPVDFEAMQIDDDLLPLMKLWHESAP